MGVLVLRSSRSVDYNGRTPTTVVTDSAGLAAALASATAGAIIGLNGPGPFVAASSGSRSEPAWLPANSGTAGNPIIIVGRYPYGHPDFSMMQNDAVGAGNGCPTIGAGDGIDYVIWEQVGVIEADSPSRPDTGPAVLWDTTGSGLRKCYILGDPASNVAGDNHNGVRFEAATDCFVEDSIIDGFDDASGGVNATGMTLYGAVNVSVLRNWVRNCNVGIYVKGTAPADVVYNTGSITFNRLNDCPIGIQTQFIDASGEVIVDDNWIDAETPLIYRATDQYARTKARNNTFVCQATAGNGGLYVRNLTASGCELSNNLFKRTSNGEYVYGDEYHGDNFAAFDYNGFHGSAAGTKWSWNSTNIANITALHAAIANSNNNVELGDDPIPGLGSDDFTIAGQALTAGPGGTMIGVAYADTGPQS